MLNIIYSKPNDLKACNNVHELALFLGFESYDLLAKFIYPNISSHYRGFFISKKNGSSRLIDAPKEKLKLIQKTILKELEKHYTPKHSTHGFIKNRSIVTNAALHVDKNFILNIDLKDFFPSIHYGRVRNLLSSYPINLAYDVATVIAHICCLNNQLPQGAPTSPILSNMICYRLDKDMQHLASKFRYTYSRYVDDITLSFTQKQGKIPKSVLIYTKNKQIKLGSDLIALINQNGFIINNNKTRVSSRDQKQLVTGLIVNNKVNVDRSYIRKTNSIIHACKKFGFENAELVYFSKFNEKEYIEKYYDIFKGKKGDLLLKVLKGRINHIKNVRGRHDPIYRKIAFKLSEALGTPNYSLLQSEIDKICESVFIINNEMHYCQGTGFMLENLGLITNEHVVEGIDNTNYDILEIFRHNELHHHRKITFLKSNKKIDLAILLPTADFDNIPRLKIGDDSKITNGTKITVIGFPQWHQGETPYINDGKVVQSKDLFGEKVYLVDIPIIHGNSGGPVLNENNEVIGVASVGSEKHDQSTKFHGFIPISTLIKYHAAT